MQRYIADLEKLYDKNNWELTFNSIFKPDNWQRFYKKHREYEAIPMYSNDEHVAEPMLATGEANPVDDAELEALEKKVMAKVFMKDLADDTTE
jgi:hypothetical protein